jgi:tRNA(adenine34) deaminase
MEKDMEFMKLALKEAKKAYIEGEVPIGAILVCNNEIIASNHNRKEQNSQAIDHAEILVIKEACHLKNDWRLNDCTLYVTVEPCLMCCGAIIQARIEKLVYGTGNRKFGGVGGIDKTLNNPKANHTVEIISNICQNEAKELMQKFFKNKRK